MPGGWSGSFPSFSPRSSGLPILAVGMIVLLLGALLLVIHEREVDEERQALIKSALWAEQNLALQLSADEERLQQLAWQLGREGAPSETFLTQVRHMVAARPELERIIVLDAEGRVSATVPPLEGALHRPREARDAFVIARAGGRAAYSPPLLTRAGTPGFELHQPIYHGDGFAGALVAVIALPALLNDNVPWWFAERYQLEISDGTAVLAAKSRVPAASGGTSHTIALDRPGHGLMLVVTVYHDETKLARNFLVAAILLLAVAAIWSLFSMRRHSSHRARAEQALRAEHAFRKAMEDSLTVGMRARDLEGRITYVNPAFCRMVGWTNDELVGRAPPMPYWIPEDMERTMALHDAVLAGRAPRDGFELRFQRKDGQRFDALVYEAPLIDADGRHTGWMGSVVDITERKRAEELARQQHEKLQHTARLAAMGEMASSIAHELNQPLSAIASYATGCLNRVQAGDGGSAELAGALAKLSRQAQRAGNIIRRVYGFVRKSEPKMGPCDLAPVVEDVVELMRPDAARRGMRIVVELPPGLPRVEADPIQIGQVIANLARNGLDAMAQTPKGQRMLVIAARPDDNGVAVSVADNGTGLSADIAEQVFTPFFTTKEEGMGMGLNICRSIVEQHGGHLRHEPRPGGGCVFHFVLPAARS